MIKLHPGGQVQGVLVDVSGLAADEPSPTVTVNSFSPFSPLALMSIDVSELVDVEQRKARPTLWWALC